MFRTIATRCGLLAMAAAAISAGGTQGEAADLSEFAGICRQMREGYGSYFGTASVRRLELELALPAVTAAQRATRQAQLGVEWLHLAQTARAIELLRAAMEHADELSPSARQRLSRDLAMAELRLGAPGACAFLGTADGCLDPVARPFAHRDTAAARRAVALYESALVREPGAIQPRWLLRLARRFAGEAGEDPRDAAPPAAPPFPRWRDVAAAADLATLDLAGGAVVDDFDGDGRLDIVTSTSDPCDHAKAFRNRGDGTFENVSRSWALELQLGGLNLVHADYDNDGDPDLLVLRGGWLHELGRVRNSLLRNDLATGGGFVDVTVEAGLAYPAYPTQTAAWADYDGDGRLDLYVGNESVRTEPSPSQLFRNNGDGTFTNLAFQAGVSNLAYAKGVAWGDYDDDGRPDLYVSNHGAPNRLYRNLGTGSFVDVARAAGVEQPLPSFATWFFDFDQDGHLDLFVADYGTPYEEVSASYLGQPAAGGRPALYHNEGGRFRDVADERGFDRPLLPMGANFGDLDNDGWLDLYLGTGVPEIEALMPNVMYRNLGGERFADVTVAGGFGHLQKGHGIAFADLNDDGQPEVFAQMGGFYPIDAFQNALFVGPTSENAWLELELVGRRANRSGVGARVAVEIETPAGRRTLHYVASSGGSFGGSPRRLHVGLGDAQDVAALIVRWPGSGTVDRLVGVEPRRRYRLIEGSGCLEPVALSPFPWRAAASRGDADR